MSSPARILWVGPVYDASGHADELRGFLRAQESAGQAPALRELSWTERRAELSDEELAQIATQRSRAEFGANLDLAVHTVLPGGSGEADGIPNVGRAMFETDRMPARWLEPLLRRDEVWVPCRQNLEAFVDSGLPEHRVKLLGGTLDFDQFRAGATPYPLQTEPGRAVFLTNFDFSARKGWEVLLRGWATAFDADDPVCLVLKTGSFYRDDAWVRERIGSFLENELGGWRGGVAPVYLLTDLLPAAAMPSLYAAADAYVLASRGEGWGRPYMEAQAMGLPTIASRWGGQREFMDEDTSWLVDGELVEIADDAELFNTLYAGHRWFDPDVDSLAEQLRAVAADWDAARHRAAPARGRLIERFGPDATARRLAELGGDLAGRRGSAAPRCVLRGRFGSTESLSTVNDGLAAGLERSGWALDLHVPDAEPLDMDAPSISHSWPHDFTPASAGPAIVVVPWEYGSAPAEWVRSVRREADRVWVPSAYVRDRFVASGMPPGIVDVVPNGVDCDRFSPRGRARTLPRTASCTFLFVGGSIWRKGIDLLVAAWETAFDPGDDVMLVIKDFGARTWYGHQNASSHLARMPQRREIAPVVYLDDDIPSRELPELYRAADVLVAPYRGEGFGLPVLEAMACGLPVVHTATGPTVEFAPPEAGWRVDARQVPMTDTSRLPPLAGDAHVQEPDLDHLVATLRAVAGDPDGRAVRGRAARAAAERWTWSNAATRAAALIDALLAEGLPLAREADPRRVAAPEANAVVVYAPVWADEASWIATLREWSETFGEADPVTLVLLAATEDRESLVPRVLEALDGCDDVPDLLLCDAQVSAGDAVARADAVLVAPGERPTGVLARRATHVITADRGSLELWRSSSVVEPQPA